MTPRLYLTTPNASKSIKISLTSSEQVKLNKMANACILDYTINYRNEIIAHLINTHSIDEIREQMRKRKEDDV